MIETHDTFEAWLQTALAEYSKVEPSAGYQGRMIAAVRARRRRPVFLWSVALAGAAVMVIAFVALGNRPLPGAPPVISATMGPPAIEYVVRAPTIKESKGPSVVRRMAPPQNSVRGVPIVAAPITPAEEAVLRLVRNSRARQLAGLVVKPRDLSKEVDPLQFKDLQIPVLGREEEQQ